MDFADLLPGFTEVLPRFLADARKSKSSGTANSPYMVFRRRRNPALLYEKLLIYAGYLGFAGYGQIDT